MRTNSFFKEAIRYPWLLVCILFFSIGGVFALSSDDINDSTITDSYDEIISRGKILAGNKFQSYEVIKCSPEVAKVDSDGKTIYQKTVYVTKQFKQNVGGLQFNVKSKFDHKFTFTYDKINHVHITYDDIKSEHSNFGWHSIYLSEITNDDIVSTVSNKYFVYKPSITGYRKLNIEGAVEIFCTADGQVKAHTDIY